MILEFYEEYNSIVLIILLSLFITTIYALLISKYFMNKNKTRNPNNIDLDKYEKIRTKSNVSVFEKKTYGKQKKIDISLTNEDFNNIKINSLSEASKAKEENEKDVIAKKKRIENEIIKPIILTEINKNNKILYTGYKPPVEFKILNPWTYPLVIYPKEGTVIREPRIFRRQLRGFIEVSFQKMLSDFFSNSFKISGEFSIPTSANSRPFEPDISLILKKSSLNLFIDIEIDEPYAGIKRNPLHCIDSDNLRDHFFTDRGWVVIRFTERQIKKEYKKCLAFVAKVVKSIDPSFIIPNELIVLPDLLSEKQWTILEAQKFEKVKYRETYLGIDSFNLSPLDDTNQTLVLTDDEEKIERLVVPTFRIIKENAETFEINLRNFHSRDMRIKFLEEGHIYLIDGVPARSVTELIDTCFPVYDNEYWSIYIASRDNRNVDDVLAQWKKEGMLSQQLGTILHKNIEKFYHSKSTIHNDEFKQFLNFNNEHKHLRVYRTEWRIFDEVNLIAGTIDLICKNPDGSFEIYDWKRTKKVVDSKTGNIIKLNNYNQHGIGPFANLSDTSYSRYCIQQNIYRHILELHYKIRIRSMYLVIMHPLLSDYHKVTVPRIEYEVQKLLSKNH